MVEGSTTTQYITPEYRTKSGERILDFTLNGNLVGTAYNGRVEYVHTDHLGGTNLTTDNTGSITQTLDYYPYGETRINENTGHHNIDHQFTGYERDTSTGLSYAGARYLDNGIGRFMSQDPVALALGDKDKMKEITKVKFKKYLGDPQSHNTYAYTRNNPIRFIDQNGEWFKEYLTGQQSFHDFSLEVGGAAVQLSENSKVWKTAIDHPVMSGAAVGVGGGVAFTAGASAATYMSLNYLGGVGTACIAGCSKITEQTLKIGKDLGNLGKIIQNSSQKIEGFTSHGLNQTISRGVTPRLLINTTKNPLVTLQQSGGNILRLSKEAGVVLNKTGKVITSYTSKNFNSNIASIVKSVIKKSMIK